MQLYDFTPKYVVTKSVLLANCTLLGALEICHFIFFIYGIHRISPPFIFDIIFITSLFLLVYLNLLCLYLIFRKIKNKLFVVISLILSLGYYFRLFVFYGFIVELYLFIINAV